MARVHHPHLSPPRFCDGTGTHRRGPWCGWGHAAAAAAAPPGTWKRGVDRVARVAVRHGDAVHAVSVLYERGGRQEWTDLWGGPGGELAEICLRSGEHLTSVEGHCGEFERSFVVPSLTLVSDPRSYGPDGVPFALPAAGGRILGFHARSGRHLDAVGTGIERQERESSDGRSCSHPASLGLA